MAERKKTPNILADLLSDQSHVTSAEKTVNPLTVLPVRQQDSKTANSFDPVETSDVKDSSNAVATKIKVTFYLSEDAVDLLEEAQRTLRRMGRGTGKAPSKGATSKSALLEEALKMACADLEIRGEESQLASILS